MAKKKAGSGSKSTAKATKKAKAAQKVERKEQKKNVKSKDAEEDDEDLEGILEKMRKEWEEAHTVTEELVEGPPSRRANATLTACPNGNHLWCMGGEFFSDDGRAYFYNDVFRYTPEKDEWRKFVSQTCPGPRSAHAVVASPAGGGKIFLFGGEFSSLHQNSFHHYRDFWCFDISTHSWDRIDTKIRPTARSGHRMAIWKHYIILFGGFYDPGITTKYLNDLWLFDMQEYKWRLVEFRETEPRPSPRSGFSFLSTPDGVVLHGGYCKEYAKGKRPIGVMLQDTWFLKLTLDTPTDPLTPNPNPTNSKSNLKPAHPNPKTKSADLKTNTNRKPATSKAGDPLSIKWERRKRPSTAYAPGLRSGCTMAAWAAKSTGVLFGGVTDEDTGEETLESVFWNDLNGYQWTGKGRWVSMTLKRPKKKAGGAKRKQQAQAQAVAPVPTPTNRHGNGNEDEYGSDGNVIEVDEDQLPNEVQLPKRPTEVKHHVAADAVDPDDPSLTIPLPRYNAMLAVLRNTLYIYGGIFERGSREYTLDDFHSIQLDKMDRYTCLKASDVVIGDGDDESSSDDEDDDDEDDDDDDDEENEDNGYEDDASTHGGSDAEGMDVDDDDEAHNIEVDPEGGDEDGDGGGAAALTAEESAALRSKATEFMGVAKDVARSPEDVISTPLPGETLAMFYARSREYWAQQAHATSENRGKQLRRAGFSLAEDRYNDYKPILQEVEKILAEAGLDEEEMRRGAAGGPGMGGTGDQSRNRR